MVPLDVEKLFSSFLNASITEEVGNKLQWSENAAKPHEHSLVFERGNPIANRLRSRRWDSRPNHRSKLVQSATGGLRNSCKIFINCLGVFFGVVARFTTEVRSPDFIFFMGQRYKSLHPESMP